MHDVEQSVRCDICPGPVDDKEIVARILYSPDLFDQGQLTPAAFRKDELNDWSVDECGGSSGVSLQRVPPATMAELDRIGAGLVSGSQRRLVPHVFAVAGRVRSVVIVASEQTLVILADGAVGNKGHCVLRSVRKLTQGEIRKLRGDLIKEFSIQHPL